MFKKMEVYKPCHTEIILNPYKIVRIIGYLIVFSFFADIGAHIIRMCSNNNSLLKIAYLFLLDEEQNFPTYLSTVLFLFGSVLALNISTRPTKPEKDILYWRGFALLFFYVSLDEFVMIHERVGKILSRFLHTTGILTFNWLIPYSLIAVIVAIFYLRFFFRLPVITRKRFLLISALFFLGPFIGELIGGLIYSNSGGGKPLLFYAVASLEEIMEMCGAMIFIAALMEYSHVQKNATPVSFQLTVERIKKNPLLL
jgi:hypothetical protein